MYVNIKGGCCFLSDSVMEFHYDTMIGYFKALKLDAERW